MTLRQIYADAPGQGSVVMDMGSRARDAAEEVESLFHELLQSLLPKLALKSTNRLFIGGDMTECRTLTEGLAPRPAATPPADNAKERQFVFDGMKAGPSRESTVARVLITTRIRGDFAAALKRESLVRQLKGVEPSTVQDMLDEALEPWLRKARPVVMMDIDDSAIPPRLTGKESQLLQTGEQIQAEQPGRMDFLHAVLCQLGLPRSRSAERSYERKSGRASLRVEAGSFFNGQDFVEQPLPYGATPRLVLVHVSSEAVRTRNPTVEIGDNIRQFLRRLGMQTSGGKRGGYIVLKRQIEALAACRMTIGMATDEKVVTVHTQPISRFEAWIHPANQDGPQGRCGRAFFNCPKISMRRCSVMLCHWTTGRLVRSSTRHLLSTFTRGWRTDCAGSTNPRACGSVGSTSTSSSVPNTRTQVISNGSSAMRSGR